MQPLAIGVDLGATKIAASLVRRDGGVLASRQTPTRAAEGDSPVIGRIADEVAALLAAAPAEVAGIGIGTPGFVDSRLGTVHDAVNLGWSHPRLADGLRARLPERLPIVIENDANAAVLGEHYFGSGRGCDDLVLLTIGSGLGCGVLSGGRLIVGGNAMAADIGHVVIDPAGRPCPCGARGCAETVISRPGLVATTREVLRRGGRSRLRDSDQLGSHEVAAAARAGDPVATAAVETLSDWLGQVLAMCAAVVDPHLLVTGGGLGVELYDMIAAPAEREMRRRLAPLPRRKVALARSTLVSSAVGAACLVWVR